MSSEQSAFPYIEFERDGELLQPVYGEGMTLRQWYKGMALPLVMDGMEFPEEADRNSMADALAREAGRLADAMLAEDAQYEEDKGC